MKKTLLCALALFIASCAPQAAVPQQPAPVEVLPDSLDGRAWLEREAKVASSLGAGPLQIAATDFGTDGDRIGAFVAIPNDQCLLAYARGSFGIEDLDLYAYADDGATLAIDEATDPHPAIVICPPHPARAYIAARIAQGRGIVALGVQSVTPFAVAAVGQALGARGRPGEEIGRAEAWPGLDERVAERRRALGGEWEEVRRVAVPADARASTHVSAELEPGGCLDVLVLPTDELHGLDVTVLDDEGRIAARAATWGRDRSSLVCTSIKTTVSVELRPRAGHGLAAVVLSRSATFGEHELDSAIPVHQIGSTLDVAGARAERAKQLRELGYPSATTVGHGRAEVGRKTSFNVDLPEGCARVDVIGGKPITGLVVDLFDASGKLLAGADGGNSPFLFVCGSGGKGRIDIEATSRSGPFAVELRSERISPPPLKAHPLAASRLLRHLGARAPLNAGAARDARVVSVDATSSKRLELSLPQGRCVDVIAALDAGGRGLELRLFGAEGAEIAKSRGATLGTARACGTSEVRAVQAELRLEAGEAAALVLVRPVAIVPGR